MPNIGVNEICVAMSSGRSLHIQTPASLETFGSLFRGSVWVSVPAYLHAGDNNNDAVVQNDTLMGAHVNPKRVEVGLTSCYELWELLAYYRSLF